MQITFYFFRGNCLGMCICSHKVKTIAYITLKITYKRKYKKNGVQKYFLAEVLEIEKKTGVHNPK
jgi:hypothetical protein